MTAEQKQAIKEVKQSFRQDFEKLNRVGLEIAITKFALAIQREVLIRKQHNIGGPFRTEIAVAAMAVRIGLSVLRTKVSKAHFARFETHIKERIKE